MAREVAAKEASRLTAAQLSDNKGLNMATVVQRISMLAGNDKIVVADVGQNQMFAARFSYFANNSGMRPPGITGPFPQLLRSSFVSGASAAVNPPKLLSPSTMKNFIKLLAPYNNPSTSLYVMGTDKAID